MGNPTDILALHDAIVADIKAAFPTFEVQFYRGNAAGERSEIKVPCILLDSDSFEVEEDNDLGSGQSPVTWNFEARIIIEAVKEPKAPFHIRAIAAKLVHFLKLRKWQIPGDELARCYPTGPARVVDASRDDFDEGLDRYCVWRVEWKQDLNLGPDVWDTSTELTPSTIFIGFTPNIGAGHEDDYIQLPTGTEITPHE